MKDQYRLYHYPICPFSRKIRIILHEKEIDYVEVIENFWEKRDKFCIINPTGMVPFLAIKRFDIDKPLLIFGVNSIIYYLENKFPKKSTIFGSLDSAVEIMKMSEWFDLKFYSDVSKYNQVKLVEDSTNIDSEIASITFESNGNLIEID